MSILQAAKPAKLEVWDDYGSPAERISVTDARWTWQGEWKPMDAQRRSQNRPHRVSATKGAEVAVWHAFGLKPGKHSVRVVILGEPVFR